MLRPVLCALLLGPIITPLAAHAQSHGCVEVPRGVPLDITVIVPLPHAPRAPAAPYARASPYAHAAVTLPGVPSHGHDCLSTVQPAPDVLRGPAAPMDILRGEAPPPHTRVTITPR